MDLKGERHNEKNFKIVFGGLLVLFILGEIISELGGGAYTTKDSDITDKQIETLTEPQDNAENDREPQWGRSPSVALMP